MASQLFPLVSSVRQSSRLIDWFNRGLIKSSFELRHTPTVNNEDVWEVFTHRRRLLVIIRYLKQKTHIHRDTSCSYLQFDLHSINAHNFILKDIRRKNKNIVNVIENLQRERKKCHRNRGQNSKSDEDTFTQSVKTAIPTIRRHAWGEGSFVERNRVWKVKWVVYGHADVLQLAFCYHSWCNKVLASAKALFYHCDVERALYYIWFYTHTHTPFVSGSCIIYQ